MSADTTIADFPAAPVKSHAAQMHSQTRIRDPRLDFFRGIAMFIILFAHIPGNWWTLWIPARFGWSDATEIFVFCSGMASAIAFGGAFARKGWWLGTARVAFRIWQVYWAHIGLFIVVAASLAYLDSTGLWERAFLARLNLLPFFDDNTRAQLIGLMTLSYVPNFFDVLPMYMVILALMPAMMAMARISPWAVAATVAAIWLLAQADILALPAEPWSDREWFFNPFGWQLIFFTGFALMIGWLPAPPVDRRLIWLAIAIVLVSAVLSFNWWRTFPHPDHNELSGFQERLYNLHLATYYFRQDISLLRAKTDFGIFRYVHFLALAYLAWILVGPKGERLTEFTEGKLGQVWQMVLAVILKVGQQSLAVFVFSMAIAWPLGGIFEFTGKSGATMLLVNGLGMMLIILCAYIAGWFKRHPWRDRTR